MQKKVELELEEENITSRRVAEIHGRVLLLYKRSNEKNRDNVTTKLYVYVRACARARACLTLTTLLRKIHHFIILQTIQLNHEP